MNKTRPISFILLTALLLAGCDQAPGQNSSTKAKGAPDISKMTDAEIEKLPKGVLDALPFGVLFKKIRGGSMEPIMEIQVGNALASLSYLAPASDNELQTAIKKFQRDIGHQETGELTVRESRILQARSTFVKSSQISVLGSWDEPNLFDFQNSYVLASGSWVVDGEKIAYPINSAKITCTRSEGSCVIHQVEIDVPSIDKHGDIKDGYNLIHQDPESYDILSWSKSEVVSESVGRCRTTTMTLNIETKEVFQVTRNNGGKCDLGSLKFPKLEKPRVARLVGSGKNAYDYWNARRREAGKLINSEEAVRLESAVKILTAYEQANKKK